MDSVILKTLSDNFPQFAVLKIAVRSDISPLYARHIQSHNINIFHEGPFSNSGFDLFVSNTTEVVQNFKTQMISTNVKAEMLYMGRRPCGYYMFPRSSISKTPLMLANHTGIIDAGYRGPLIGAFRNTSQEAYIVEQNTKLLQICHPTLCPIYVIMVDESELSTTTRGEDGFGSTGK
jgi:dUTP pyrophosphatase